MGKKRDYTKFSKETIEPAVEAVREDNAFTEMVEEIENEPIIGIVTDCVKLNVREEANSMSAVVAVIDASTELVIIEEESTKDFFKICTASGLEGYCMKKFVTIMP